MSFRAGAELRGPAFGDGLPGWGSPRGGRCDRGADPSAWRADERSAEQLGFPTIRHVVNFLVQRTAPLPLDEAWRRLTEWPRHGAVVPLTRVTVTTPPPTHEDRPTTTAGSDEPTIDVTVVTSPTSLDTSPELDRRR